MNDKECLQKLKLLNALMQDLFDNMDLDEAEAEEDKDKAEKEEDNTDLSPELHAGNLGSCRYPSDIWSCQDSCHNVTQDKGLLQRLEYNRDHTCYDKYQGKIKKHRINGRCHRYSVYPGLPSSL